MSDALDQIAAEVGAIEQSGLVPPCTPPGGDAAAAAGEPDITPAQLWASIPRMLGSVLSMAFPELQQVYTDDACRLWGECMVPVAAKYGWNVTKDTPEFALFVASTPLVIGTGVVLVKHRRARAAAGEGARQAKPDAMREDVPPASI